AGKSASKASSESGGRKGEHPGDHQGQDERVPRLSLRKLARVHAPYPAEPVLVPGCGGGTSTNSAPRRVAGFWQTQVRQTYWSMMGEGLPDSSRVCIPDVPVKHC